MTKSYVHYGDNLKVIRKLKDESVDLVYIDPPFNTGKVQSRVSKKAVRSEDPVSQKGFCGNSYELVEVGKASSYEDSYEDYLSFLRERLVELRRVLKPSGSLYLHLDYREAAYARILGDIVFGRDNFLNEIIWAYDYGAKPKTRWPAKHDNILMWVKKKGKHFFGVQGIDRIPYMAPGMVGAEKAARGKLPTDCWWHTIVSPTGKEKTGYPTQKPIGVLERIVRTSCPEGGVVLDCFAGSGTTGEAALRNGRNFILVDSNPDAIRTMRKRFKSYSDAGKTIRYLKSK